MHLSRRNFLGIRRPSRGTAIRPPWAIADALFEERCTRCDDCVAACPTGLLVRGDGGLPEADFTPGRAPQGCTFCGDCRTACREQALLAVDGQPPWRLTVSFAPSCLAEQGVVCRTCGESCEVGAIRFLPRPGGVFPPRLEADACTGCGACLADCPTQAMSLRPHVFSVPLRSAA